MLILLMIRTQVQLPEDLYRDAERVASDREVTLTEIVRLGLEYMVHNSPARQRPISGEWTPPAPRRLGQFRTSPEQWRELASAMGGPNAVD